MAKHQPGVMAAWKRRVAAAAREAGRCEYIGCKRRRSATSVRLCATHLKHMREYIRAYRKGKKDGTEVPQG